MKRIGVLALMVASAVAVLPTAASARDWDDRGERGWHEENREREWRAHERREWREHERREHEFREHEARERYLRNRYRNGDYAPVDRGYYNDQFIYNSRGNNGYYANPPANQGYYDSYGNFHPNY